MRVITRGLGVISVLAVAGAAATWQLAPLVRSGAAVVSRPDPATSRALVAVVVLACAAVLVGWWLWLVVSTFACTLAALESVHRPPGWLIAPRVVRGLLGVAVGTAVGPVLAPVAPSVAAHTGPDPVLPGALTGLRLPDRVTDRPAHRPSGAARAGVAVVAPGESLWSITSELLPRPTPRRVARTWPRLYAANRSVLGPDPDLIRPGSRLVLPPGLRHGSRAQRGARR